MRRHQSLGVSSVSFLNAATRIDAEKPSSVALTSAPHRNKDAGPNLALALFGGRDRSAGRLPNTSGRSSTT
jgi:hypothetical protein